MSLTLHTDRTPYSHEVIVTIKEDNKVLVVFCANKFDLVSTLLHPKDVEDLLEKLEHPFAFVPEDSNFDMITLTKLPHVPKPQ